MLNVTYYHPWGLFYPPRSGADTMACAHLEYFRGRGFSPQIVVRDGTPGDRNAFESHYSWAAGIVVIDTRRRPEIHRLSDSWDFGDYLAAHALLAECREVRQALGRPTDLAFLNYVFSAPLLDAIPRRAFRVLESVDLMAHHYVRRQSSPARFQRLMAIELELYALFDRVLMINAEEDAYARARCGANLAYVPRPVPVRPPGDEPAGAGEYDLLFVGSDHPPNIEGAQWFYDNVFRPLLKPHGLRWAIVGSVCNRLSFRDRHVAALGFVDDLGSVYRRSKVAVVPLFQGAGISIKILEAMGQRMPVVTSVCGRRGLPRDADAALICRSFEDETRQVADDIIALCSSASMRARYGRAAADFIDRHFGVAAYRHRMDELLNPIFGRSELGQANSAQTIADERNALPRSHAA